MKKIFKFAFPFIQVCVICILVLSSVYNVSCRVSTQGIQLLSGDYESPELLNVKSVSTSKIIIEFSEEVKVTGVTLCEASNQNMLSDFAGNSGETGAFESSFDFLMSEPDSIPLNQSLSSDGKQVFCNLENPLKIGQKYILYGIVEDKNGNSLTFASPVIGFNSHPATIVMTEIQDKTTTGGGVEFVEFYVLAPGNLAGLVFSSANDGEEFDYIFPAVEVNAKEIIVLHLRNSDEGCVSEFTEDLVLSSAPGSSISARDIWIENSQARLGASQDVLTLFDVNSGTIKDCFMYARNNKTEWSKTEVQVAANRAFESGIWKGGSTLENAFMLSGTSVQGIFERTNIDELELLAESGTLDYDCICSGKDDWERITPKHVSPGLVK